MDDLLKEIATLIRHLALNQIANAKRKKRSASSILERTSWQQEEDIVCELLSKVHFAEMNAEEKRRRNKYDRVGGTD